MTKKGNLNAIILYYKKITSINNYQHAKSLLIFIETFQLQQMSHESHIAFGFPSFLCFKPKITKKQICHIHCI